MSFTEGTLVKKLLELNSSQQSIQTLSFWVIHHRKHHNIIVKTWYKEFQKVSEDRKLTFLYLANDVIQNSKKKGPEYGKEYGLILAKVFKHMGETIKNPDIFNSIDRLLNIWEQRGVYSPESITIFRNNLRGTKISGGDATPKPKENADSGEKTEKNSTEAVPAERKRKSEDKPSNGSTSSNKSPTHSKKPKIRSNDGTPRSDMHDLNGSNDAHVKLQSLSPAALHLPGDPPEPEELISVILSLENSASSDAVVRGKIANLPTEVSDISLLTKIEDKEAAARLALQVNEAVSLLNDYNARLTTEMENRKKLAVMLKDYLHEQRGLLQQAEQRLEEYSKKVTKIKNVQREIRNHLHNLPDLKQLPDVTGGLAPLPSAVFFICTKIHLGSILFDSLKFADYGKFAIMACYTGSLMDLFADEK